MTPPCCAWPVPACPRPSAGVAVTTDSNPRCCALDPRAGTALTLAEGVANLACVGATPVAVVNCLNFGNPEHPEVMWQLSECIDGMAEACRALVAAGHRRQRQPLQRERRAPTSTRRRCSACSAWSTCCARPPPGLAWREGDTLVLLGARAAADGSFPLDGSRWATERRQHRERDAAGRSICDGHAARVRLRGRTGRRHRLG